MYSYLGNNSNSRANIGLCNWVTTGPGRFTEVKADRSLTRPLVLVTLNKWMRIASSPNRRHIFFKYLPYQVSMVGSAPTMIVTGNGLGSRDGLLFLSDCLPQWLISQQTGWLNTWPKLLTTSLTGWPPDKGTAYLSGYLIQNDQQATDSWAYSTV